MKKILKHTLFMLTGLFLFSFTFTSCKKHHNTPAATTVTDADGNVYQTVQIGTQTWTTSNFQTTKLNDGTPIPNVIDKASWDNLGTPAYTMYDFDVNNKLTYGCLYDWHAVNTGKLAPAGWHVPTEAEWQTLIAYLGGNVIAGGKLKEVGNVHWALPNSDATNESGFTALPGGTIIQTGDFGNITKSSQFWTSSEKDAFTASSYILNSSNPIISLSSQSKSAGCSVRLIKD
jgi:uncharacterized protein (TIGR02145 family)